MKSSNAVIYARVSSKEQERERYSIDAQMKYLRQYATDNSLNVVREFQEAESAKIAGRAKFNKMLEFIQANPDVKYLLCEKTDRLSRNFKDIATIDSLVQNQGLTILLVKENSEISKDSKSHENFMFGIKALMAKNYSDNLSEEVIKGMREKASQGRYPGGSIPYGYLIDKNVGEILPDPERAHLVVELFELYAANKMSLRALAGWARTKSMTTPRSGKPITISQIDRMLKNPFYYGDFRWAGELFRGIHKPIVTRKLFDAVQQAFRVHHKPQFNRRSFAFGNLLVCAKCGCKITAEIKKGKYVYYHCTGMRGGCDLVYVREADLIDQYSELLGPLVLTEDKARMIMSQISKRRSGDVKKIASERLRLNTRIGLLSKWTEQAYIDKLEGTIGKEQWQSLTSLWETERSQLSEQLRILNQENQNIVPAAQRILELSQKLPALWDSKNSFEKRRLVDLLYSNSTLDGANLYATYNKPFSFIAEGTQTQKWRG